MIRESRLHRWRDPQCFVNPTKVIVHKMQGHGVTVVLNLLAKSVCEPREAPHTHTHCEILPFYKRCADVLGVGIAGDVSRAASNARRGAIAAFVQTGRHTVNLDQHRIVNVSAKGIFHGIHVNPVTVCSELNPV